jgi:cytochrome oxidase Cu insertion factor (SCO1/SenC/PrrC family)
MNPYWTSSRDLRKFDNQHGLQKMAHSHFVTGPTAALNQTWQAYPLWVQQDPQTLNVEHTSYLYVIGPYRHERRLLTGSADRSLSASYSLLIAQLAQQTDLRRTGPL